MTEQGKAFELVPVAQIPRGVWLAAGALTGGRVPSMRATLESVPYPCLCWRSPRSCGQHWCPCWGRADVLELPGTCCAWRHPRLSAYLTA